MESFRKDKWPGDEVYRFLCVWLWAEKAMNADKRSAIVGWHPTTVRIAQQNFIKHGTEDLVEKRCSG